MRIRFYQFLASIFFFFHFALTLFIFTTDEVILKFSNVTFFHLPHNIYGFLQNRFLNPLLFLP
jgi:ABC-type transport system involved in cytochrome c biogenesis permease subunit